MIIAISGSSGLIGRHLRNDLHHAGHKVRAIVRPTPGEQPGQHDIRWDIGARKIEASKLDGVDAIIHLAGEPIADGKWTERKKRAIRESRVEGTKLLAEVISKLPHPPATFISASAIGYYGSRGDDLLTESAAAGTGFLADVVKEWESATEPAAKRGTRVVLLRTGVVLAREGGALAKMLGPFKLGLGGKIASGEQWVSWISLSDAVRAIIHCLEETSLQGPVNLVGPRPVTNAQLTRTLGDVLGRPTFMPLPAFLMRWKFGEMAGETVLASQRCEPAKLHDSKFRFQHGDIEGAIRAALR